ncbi:MAG TPA: hypothetical protein ENN69_04070 [Spirochaetia bacterium]|nr:hypothetical protein [Spirochaetia bacterium]
MLTARDDVIKAIGSGTPLFLAGDENVLRGLPQGNWVAGTIPYFMDKSGGVVSKELIDMTELPTPAAMQDIRWYGEAELENLPGNTPDPGFTFLILPAASGVHLEYAQNAPNYPDLFVRPTIGWISGVLLDDLGTITPKVVNGLTGEFSDSKGIAMHCALPEGKLASIGIINIFEQGDGDSIRFEQEGFSVKQCLVNGQTANFAEYLTEKKINIELPLVANYSGTMVNVSFQKINETEKTVDLYAPVFQGVEYKIAAPVADYVGAFTQKLAVKRAAPLFSCNCILNFLYSKLEGKKTGPFTGPITFGEIAYQLVNQTLVYLDVT